MADNIAKTFTLKTVDGEQFIVPEAVAMQSQSIRHLIEDECIGNTIPLPNVHSRILAMVLEYCTKHMARTEKATDTPVEIEKADGGSSAEMPKPMSPEELKQWDAEFLDIDTDTLYNLILAANYLDIPDLLDLTCQKVADMIKGKKPEEIRNTFGIENDFTKDEEEAIRRESGWAFEEEN